MVFQELDNLSASEAVEAIAHLKSLIETRTFKKEQLQEDRVVADLRRLAWAASQGSVQMRLEALSVLGKAAEVSVPIRNSNHGAWQPAWNSPWPRTPLQISVVIEQ